MLLITFVTTALKQELFDWKSIISKAHFMVQSAQTTNNNTEATGSTQTTLTEDQRKGRDLYFFAKNNNIRSNVCHIYSNVALACLGACRLLQACYQFLDYLLILTLLIGEIG